MIERQRGENTLVCDDCGESLDKTFSFEEFDEMLSYARGEGWRIRRDNSQPEGYAHHCPDCKTTSPLAAQRKLLGL